MTVTGPVAEQISEALLTAFSPDQFDQMLFYKLGRVRTRISMARNYDSIVFDVIVAANAQRWLKELVVAASQSRPEDPAIAAAADALGLGPRMAPALESIIHERAPMLDPVRWRIRLAAIEHRICRIEDAATARNGAASSRGPLGTGFLVGPDLCLTSSHVVEGLFNRSIRAEDLTLRFDYARDSDGKEIYPGTVYRLASDWQVASFAYSGGDRAGSGLTPPNRDELDITILRVANNPGLRPIGAAEPGGQRRGWLTDVSVSPPAAGDDVLILQHPQGEPLQLAFGKILSLNANQTRVYHDVNTDHGSSGSPCFSLALDLIGVHQGANRTPAWEFPSSNRSVPIGAIRSLLAERHPGQRFFQPEA
jgi:hypothetical protein